MNYKSDRRGKNKAIKSRGENERRRRRMMMDDG